MSAPTSGSSGSSAPNNNLRFTSQNSTAADDTLKSQTVGLVQLSDFRKRRAEALEQKEREQTQQPGISSSTSTPTARLKKKRKGALAAKGKLSFNIDDDEDGENNDSAASSHIDIPRTTSNTPDDRPTTTALPPRKKLQANAALATAAPKAMTKSALLKDAQTRDQLRQEFLSMRARVKATPFILPFVFYDGTNIPGGTCKVKKGEHVWRFLDKARKVGAEHGAGSGDKGRREWARVGVDDLMLVRAEIIVPHHYEFYHFLADKTLDFSGQRLFPFSAEPTAGTPEKLETDDEEVDMSTYDPLARSEKGQQVPLVPDEELEGVDTDPGLTKVVDRRWYERNKHIFPASIWEEYDTGKDYSTGIRKDAEGNSFFFS